MSKVKTFANYERYMDRMFNPDAREHIISTVKSFLETNPEINAIACTGVSGILGMHISFILHELLPYSFYIRKGSSHSTIKYIGTRPKYIQDLKYIILDDLVDSGNTVRRIISYVAKEYYNAPNINTFKLPKAIIVYDLEFYELETKHQPYITFKINPKTNHKVPIYPIDRYLNKKKIII
jgi:hypothetical protein